MACARLQELGITDTLAELKPPTPAKKTREKRKKPDAPADPNDLRRSGRARTEVNYAEDVRPERAPAAPKDYSERLAAVQLDEETAEKLRLEMEQKRVAAGPKKPTAAKKRGPIDSGKGVRVQV